MASLSSDRLHVDIPRDEIMDTRAVERDPSSARGRRVLDLIDTWFSDRRGSISRPKLLFSISFLDALLVTVTGLVAALATGDGADWDMILLRSVAVALAVVAVLRRNWSYTIAALHRVSAQVEKIAKALLGVFCVIAGGAYLAGIDVFAPETAVTWLVLAALSLVAARLPIARILDRLSAAGRLVRRTVIVGGGPEGEAVIAALERDSGKQLHILGIFDDRGGERSSDSIGGYAKLGNFEQLSAFCRDAGVDLLIVTVPMTAEQRLLQILRQLFTLTVDVRISALNSKLRLSSAAYSYIGRVPMLAVMDKPLTDWDRVLKNMEDRMLGTLLLVLAAPVMVLVAAAIRLESKGPVFFRQRRFGFNNELIEIYKFRSMRVDMEDATASKLVTKDDPRVTRVGRFIRKTSLDELPQLINVVLGEMSLVGPRPHATGAKAQSDLYQTVVDGYFARHRVKPGVTGWAQINGWRGETDTHEKIQRRVEADLYYIDNWSVLFDLYIIAMTPLALISAKNAY
jgi:Undecaprenyl-phosphate glucose phosphotransferase